MDLLYDPVIPLLQISRENHEFRKIHAHQCSLQHYLQQPRYGSNLNAHRQKNEQRRCGVCVHIYLHTHTQTPEYYSAIKKNNIMLFAARWMDLEIIIQSEINQTEKNKYYVIS